MFQPLAPVLDLQGTGLSARALLKLLDVIDEQQIRLHSLHIRRLGRTVAEFSWAPYRADERHMLYSLSKSFTSTAIGFAVQEGLLDLDQTLMEFFGDRLPSPPCGQMPRVTLRHLLTMNTGHDPEPDIFESEDPVRSFLESYIPHAPGSFFRYNTAATFMLSAVLTERTGQTLTEYLTPRLFEPLGFGSDAWWQQSPADVDYGGFGLNLTVQEIGAFGEFLLRNGKTEQGQLLDPQWFHDASTAWSDNAATGGQGDWGQGYGYQFWLCESEGVYRGDGAFGQLFIVSPEHDLVIACTAGLDNMQEELRLFWDHLLPALDKPDASTAADEAELLDRLQTLQLHRPALTIEPGAAALDGSYLISDHPLGFTELTLESGLDGLQTITLLRDDGATLELTPSSKHWTEAPLLPLPEDKDPAHIYTDAAKLFGHCRYRAVSPQILDLVFPATPNSQRWTLSRFGRDGILLEAEAFGQFGGPEYTRIIGTPK